ncbi:VWA domain-containing protein [Mycobacterium syngnathidarum]
MAGPPQLHRMLASALAGRPVEVVEGSPGVQAWSDGRTITVDPGVSPRHTIEAIVVQAALIGAGSLTDQLMRPLLRHRRLRRRYLRVEGPRAVAELRDLLPRSLDYLIHDDIASLSDSPVASLALARTRATIPESGLYLGALRPSEVMATLRKEPVTLEPGEPDQRPGRDTRASEAADNGATRPVPHTRMPADISFFSAVTGSTLIGRLLRALLRGAGASGTDGPAGGRSRSSAPATTRAAALTIGGTVAREAATSPSGEEFRYPEWDPRIQGYRPGWCTVRVVEPDDRAPGSMAAAELGLRRPLSRLGTGPETRHRQRHGDDIDVDAAVEYTVGARTGSAPDDALYLATVRDRRDLSVLILLDVSGSAAEAGVGRVAVHDHQRTAVAALATTMQRLGDRVAVYAYSSHGRHNVRLTTLKTFAEHNDHALLKRLHHLQPSGFSRLGAAIRHGANVIEQNGGTIRRLLMVVSDGLAFDQGYGLDHGARDVRRALAEVRGRGTGCLCLTVGTTAPAEDLRLVFGTAAHASVPRPDQLAPVIVRLCTTALRSAEVNRNQ